ncbi:hypothetical protein CKAH01_04010 [Colletotrichum kahawae]|uniref:Uncharacterized protein n=1 Tax=Colletotrichum kahawae TaxID=34407 RepID=A0AAE0DAF3_COLKA|nr:hypothetical protein CKAH01_04010 [Colletotrichum kahawae]
MSQRLGPLSLAIVAAPGTREEKGREAQQPMSRSSVPEYVSLISPVMSACHHDSTPHCPLSEHHQIRPRAEDFPPTLDSDTATTSLTLPSFSR